MTISTAPFVLLIGMDTPASLDHRSQLRFNDGYSQIHTPEVVESHPGFVRGTRYELVEPDLRGDLGPRWLSAYEIGSVDAAEAFVARVDGPRDAYPVYETWTQVDWSLRWRHLWARYPDFANTTDPEAAAYLFLIGMDVPTGTTEADLEEFNEFYSHDHLPEVVAAMGWDRGTRFQLRKSYDHPAPGAPQFLAAYEGSERIFAVRAANGGKPNVNEVGPAAWNARTTQFRLLYRRIGSYSRKGLLRPDVRQVHDMLGQGE